jgi:capsular exopolysaccharide synthesis family protein
MSRIFNALRQSEIDQKTGTEAPAAAKTEVQPAAKVAALSPSVWTTVEVEETPISAPPPPETMAVESPALPEIEPVAAVAVEDSTLPEPAPFEWTAPEASAISTIMTPPESPAGELLTVQEPPPNQLESIETIDLKTADSAHLVAMADERGLGAEKFRVLAARLNNLRNGAKPKILQVTSSVIGEGKTLVSANLALTLAKRSSQSVLLLEGDLRKPALSNIFGVSKRPGLNEWWNSKDPIHKFLVRAGETSLYLLPSKPVQHPASVLQSGRLADALAEFSRQFDWIIVDTPPLLPMADSNLWARLADGTLLVVRKGVVTRTALKQAMETMDSPKLVGVVLNDATDFAQVNYYDQYYSGKPIKKHAPKHAATKPEEAKPEAAKSAERNK